MPKYRVKDHVGEIRHGVGKDVTTYRSGEVLDVDEKSARPIRHLLEPAVEEKPEKPEKSEK